MASANSGPVDRGEMVMDGSDRAEFLSQTVTTKSFARIFSRLPIGSF